MGRLMAPPFGRAAALAWAAILVPGLSCRANLDIPESALVACQSDHDCPPGAFCDSTEHLCVLTRDVGPTPPGVIIEQVGPASGRSVAQMPFRLRISDLNGPPRGNDTVQLAVEYSVDFAALGSAATWFAATAANPAETLGIVPNGASSTYTWNAFADADSTGTRGLFARRADTNGDENADADNVAFRDPLFVRFVAKDSASLSAAPVLSAGFAAGNDPPAVSFELLDGAYSHDVNIVYRLTDEGRDVARVEAEFCAGAATSCTWTRALPIGDFLVQGLQTAPASDNGAMHVFIWDSRALPQTDPSLQQGVGLTSWQRVAFRLRAIDEPGGDGVEHYGAWVEAATTFALLNQSPPRLEGLSVPESSLRRATGPVTIRYQAIDAESDLVDVRFQFSLDAGRTWRTCEEYPLPLSDGIYDLTTGPPLASGVSGVAHTFIWDTSGLTIDGTTSTFLRAYIADDYAESAVPPVVLLHPAGPAGLRPVPASSWHCGERLAQVDCTAPCVWNAPDTHCDPARLLAGGSPLGANPKVSAAADFNGDGLFDLAVGNSAPAEVSVAVGNGDGTFAVATNTAVGGAVRALATADFNRDSIADIAVLDGGGTGSEVTILRGGGTSGSWDGTFTAQPAIAMVGDWQLLAVDFNADGYPDLASGFQNGGGGGAGLLMSDGAGGFSPQLLVSVAASGVVDVGVGDFDGDGDLDVAAPGLINIVLFLGNNDGTFVDSGFAQLDTPVRAALAWDFDQDGDDDLAVLAMEAFPQDRPGRLDLMSLNASGEWVLRFSSVTVRGPNALAAGDVNADGIPDLAVAGLGVSVWLGSGFGGLSDGTLGEEVRFDVNGWWDDIVLADFNHDRADDAVVTYNYASQVALLMRSQWEPAGAAALEGPAEYTTGSGPRALATADFNADGITDVAVADGSESIFSTRDVSLLFGGGEGGSGAGYLSVPIGLDGGWQAWSVVAGDFNNDGITDLATANHYTPGVTIFVGRGAAGVGDGTFTATTYNLTDDPHDLASGDFDGDGDLDLVLASDSALRLVENLAGVNFVEGPANAAFSSVTSVSVADVNEDGILDLLAAGSFGAVLLRGNGTAGVGDGTFAARAVIGGVPAEAEALVVSDFNGDDILDLAVAIEPPFSGDEVAVLLGNGSNGRGDGTFGSAQGYGTTLQPSDITVADFNGDGILDLGVVSWRIDDLSLLLGRGTGGLGNGTFAAPVGLGAGDQPVSIVAADFDDDGLADVVAGNYFSNDLSLLIGQIDVRPAWTFALSPDGGLGNSLVGLSPVRPGRDRLGYAFAQARAGLRVATVVGESTSFAQALRAGMSGLPAGLVPLTPPMQASGDVTLSRVVEPSLPGVEPTGDRLEVRPRLNLSLVNPSDQRGVIVELPILAARCADANTNDLCDAVENAVRVRVFRRSPDWRRASSLPCQSVTPPALGAACDPALAQPVCDPIAGQAVATGLLPRRPVCVSNAIVYEDVIVEGGEWSEILADGDSNLATGTGPRFVLRQAAVPPRVRVLTEALGEFQAFLELP